MCSPQITAKWDKKNFTKPINSLIVNYLSLISSHCLLNCFYYFNWKYLFQLQKLCFLDYKIHAQTWQSGLFTNTHMYWACLYVTRHIDSDAHPQPFEESFIFVTMSLTFAPLMGKTMNFNKILRKWDFIIQFQRRM